VFALAGLDRRAAEVVLKLVNRAATAREVTVELPGVAGARATTLSADDPTAENSLDDPDVVVPRESRCAVANGVLRHTLPANSFSVVRLALRR
jgi:alpha-L-arabinofuranosidase